MSQSNPCNKQVKPPEAYEVWSDGDFTYWVLRKYKSLEGEAKDPYARWYCGVTSSFTQGAMEFGDCLAADIKRTCKVIANPLTREEQTTGQDGYPF